MGLDIVAYSRIEKEPQKDVKEALDKLLSNRFGDEVANISNEVWEETQLRAPDLTPGTWLETDETSQHHFRAGSYSGYNGFRKHLAYGVLGVSPETIWEAPDAYEGKPCYELIDFSDCDGIISWSVCEKLYNDMVTNREKFKAYVDETFDINPENEDDEENWYAEALLRNYDNFITAFEYGKDNGMVRFC